MTNATATIATRIADAADDNGIWAADVMDHTDIMAAYNIPATTTRATVSRAAHIQGNRAADMAAAYGTTSRAAANRAARKVEVCQKGQKGHDKPARCKIFNKYSATAVLRWMGANGWNKEDAAVALATVGAAAVKESSIEAGLYDGTKGDKYGKPAPLTAYEAKKLRAATV